MASSDIRVETNNESVVLDTPACVEVYQGGKLIAKVTAEVKAQKGADSKSYPAIEFKEVEYPE